MPSTKYTGVRFNDIHELWEGRITTGGREVYSYLANSEEGAALYRELELLIKGYRCPRNYPEYGLAEVLHRMDELTFPPPSRANLEGLFPKDYYLSQADFIFISRETATVLQVAGVVWVGKTTTGWATWQPRKGLERFRTLDEVEKRIPRKLVQGLRAKVAGKTP